MSAKRIVYLPAVDRVVTMESYVAAIKTAKANPDETFKHGLTSWWPTKGRDIVRQFRRGIHQRINDAIPYHERGIL